MDFIKNIKRGKAGRKAGIGSLIIANGYLRIRINKSNARLKDIGLIKGGIGVVLEDDKNRKTKSVQNKIIYDKDDIPVEFQGDKYRFYVPAEKLSDTEFVFHFKNARMLNKK